VLCRRAGAPLVAGYVIAPMDAQAWADHPKPEVDFESAPFLQLYGKILSEVRPYGIDDLWDVALGGPAPAHNLVYQPRAFLPNGDSFGADHSFVGPCLSLADRHQDWRPPEENRPLLLASLGTSPSDHALELLRTCVRASDGQPWHLVVILGDQLRPGDLGELPANVTAYPWLPHTAVLPYATGFLTHAGMGSLMEAFSFGVPVLMAPDNAEQRSNAEHAVTHGVGAELPAGRDDITADRLRELIIDLLANSSTRRRVAALRAEIEAAGGAVAAADQLLTLASERNVSNPGPGRRRPAAPRR
jgi:MGT family glycosyltransferase